METIDLLFACDPNAEVQMMQYTAHEFTIGIDGVDREGDTYVIY